MMKKAGVVATFAMLVLACETIVAAPGAELVGAVTPSAPAAGQIPLGITIIEMRAVVAGWSVKKDVFGKHVQNDRKEDLGKIEDIIITPEDQAAFAIVGVGGFLGIAERRVAIPMRNFKVVGDHFLLKGATKDVLRGMPPFIYTH
ncbi:MAG TPA: PRC-barrel domain-containing protein [Candidatus Baltobacteraceae bacterium]